MGGCLVAISVLEGEARGERAIRADLLARTHQLSNRQAAALARVLETGRLTIQEFEGLCPDVNRRTLQRDLQGMVEPGILIARGETNRLEYVPGKEVA